MRFSPNRRPKNPLFAGLFSSINPKKFSMFNASRIGKPHFINLYCEGVDKSPNEPLIIRRQTKPQELAEIVDLFDEAFSSKFAQAVKNPVLRTKLWANVINFEQVTIALQGNEILGMMLLSFHDSPGFKKIKAREIVRILGIMKSVRAALIFSLFSKLDWKPAAPTAYVEAISVSSTARGLGIGSMLITDAIQTAKEVGATALDLSVVLENELAEKLYLKLGFTVIATKKSKILPLLTDVSGAHVMRYQL